MPRTTPEAGTESLLTIGKAAALLGVHPDTLRNWDRAGRLPAHRHPINGYRLYRREDLRRLLADINPGRAPEADGYG